MWREILEIAVGFVVHGAFLLLALWAMVRIQGLQYHWPGLLICAGLGTALDMIPFVGHYLAVATLFIALKLVTHEDFTGVVFTTAVAFAVTFCLKLFLVGAMMPAVHLSEEDKRELRKLAAETAARQKALTNSHALVAQLQGTNRVPARVGGTNMAERTNLLKLSPAASAFKRATNAAPPVTNTLTASAAFVARPTNVASVPASVPVPALSVADQRRAKLNGDIVRSFYLKGIIKNSRKSMAMIDTTIKTYTLGLGESIVMDSSKGRIQARLDRVAEDSVTLSIAGEEVVLNR